MPRARDLLAVLVVPERCLHCRAPAARAGALLCDGCRRALPWLGVGGCARCGLPGPCPPGRCPARGAAFRAAWAPLAYEGPARSLALAGKERAARRVASWFAAAMTARAPARVTGSVQAVVPVPADPVRGRRRGEDHARLLAVAVAAALDVPCLPVLARPRAAVAQHHQSRAGRRRVPRPVLVAPPPDRVLLVDDVHTTGATLRAAAAVLHDGGARRVTALTALRTLR
ncbi:ComF family protein [Patulibacter sp. NPDC049589]|uniref:ComF family protein n=1 Tax=Patulibacter sp. NPDC049589 TaxID=3154731 RepID=UPI003443EA7E